MKKISLIITLILVALVLVGGYYLLTPVEPVDDSDQSTDDLLSYETSSRGVAYMISYPRGWYPHEREQVTIFTHSEDLNVPQATEGYALGDQFVIAVSELADVSDVTSYEGWLIKHGVTEDNPLFKSRENVSRGDLAMVKVVMEGSGVAGEVLTYFYFVDVQRIIALSQFPYDPQSQATKDFEQVVNTLTIGQGIEVVAIFDNKIVYTTDASLSTEPYVIDCQSRGGAFNSCGSICATGSEVCVDACAYTCEGL